MIVWTHAVLGVLYACVLCFDICTCSVQLSMFHMERRSRNTLIIIVIIIIITITLCDGVWLLFVSCLTSQQHASVHQGRICTDNFTCSHTEIEVADQTFYLTQSQYTDTGLTSPSADPITPGAWQGSHWSANFEVTGMTRPGKILVQAGFEPRIFRS